MSVPSTPSLIQVDNVLECIAATKDAVLSCFVTETSAHHKAAAIKKNGGLVGRSELMLFLVETLASVDPPPNVKQKAMLLLLQHTPM